MRPIRVLAILAIALTTSGAIAQTSGTTQGDLDTDIALLRSDIQAQKNDIIAHSMQFTDAQAKAFWPLYRDYSHQQQVIGDQRVSLIKDYASQYATMDDAKAEVLMSRWLNYDEAKTKLRSDVLSAVPGCGRRKAGGQVLPDRPAIELDRRSKARL